MKSKRSHDLGIGTKQKIFISYRREDTAGHVGRIRDRIGQRFSEVFLDLESVSAGQDFAKVISDTIDASCAMIVVIGRNWLTPIDETGRRRIDDPQDFVRFEVALGLKQGIRLIPVLVQNASMPRVDQLPEDLKPLVRLHALDISDKRFEHDVTALIHTLREVCEINLNPLTRLLGWLKGGPRFRLVLALSLAIVGVVFYQGQVRFHLWENSIGLVVYGYIVDERDGHPEADVQLRIHTVEGLDITKQSLPSDHNGFYVVEAIQPVPRTARLIGTVSGCRLSLRLTEAHEYNDYPPPVIPHPVFRHMVKCPE